jgi:hypothetical protein
MTEQLLARIAAMPHTHKVTVIQEDGTTHEHTTRNEASAQNYAEHMRFRGAVSVVVGKIEG